MFRGRDARIVIDIYTRTAAADRSGGDDTGCRKAAVSSLAISTSVYTPSTSHGPSMSVAGFCLLVIAGAVHQAETKVTEQKISVASEVVLTLFGNRRALSNCGCVGWVVHRCGEERR